MARTKAQIAAYARILDHDHLTWKFRGWLCSKCNVGLGLLGDTKESVMKMLDYLLRSELS
jgi:hypothetical protein